MAYTLETTVGEILKDYKAVEILEKYAPGSRRTQCSVWRVGCP